MGSNVHWVHSHGRIQGDHDHCARVELQTSCRLRQAALVPNALHPDRDDRAGPVSHFGRCLLRQRRPGACGDVGVRHHEHLEAHYPQCGPEADVEGSAFPPVDHVADERQQEWLRHGLPGGSACYQRLLHSSAFSLCRVAGQQECQPDRDH